MEFECYVCAQSLSAHESQAGQTFACPSCGQMLEVPLPVRVARPPSPQPASQTVPTPVPYSAPAPAPIPAVVAAPVPQPVAASPAMQAPRARVYRAPVPRPPDPRTGYTPGAEFMPRQESGFKKFLWYLLLAVAAAFGLAMVHFNESPQRVARRIIPFIQGLQNGKEAEPNTAPAEPKAAPEEPKAAPEEPKGDANQSSSGAGQQSGNYFGQ